MSKSKEKKAKTTMYLFHEMSSYLPLLEDEEFDDLVEDIKEFGQIEPIVLYEGKILDGRNRYRACKKLGIEVNATEWKPSEATGITPLQYVISTNIMRRHLNHAQRSEIGLLLLDEEERLADERKKELIKLRTEEGKNGLKTEAEVPEEALMLIKEKYGEKGKSAKKVGEKVKVGKTVMGQAKKIKEIAEREPIIAEEWERAKREEIGVGAVYEKAKAVEEAETLPSSERKKILQQIKEESMSPKQLREEIKEAKEEQRRVDIAKKSAELRKKHEEMQVLLKRIEGYKKDLEGFKNGVKDSEAKLNVLIEEITEQYPQWKGLEPAVLITKMSLHYDTLDTEIYNDQLNELRDKYTKLMKPLQEKLKALEEEYKTQRDEIISQKKERQDDIRQLERYENLMNTTIEKIDLNVSHLAKTKKDLEAVLKEYDEKYK